MLTYIFVKAFIDYKTTSTDVNYSGGFLGVGAPVAIGVGLLLLGVVLMVFANFVYPKFFKRKRETADPGILEGDRRGRSVRDGGLRRKRMSEIIVGYDGSDSSKAALEPGARIRQGAWVTAW